MTALDFPSSPSNGDIYNNYVYDATRGVWNVYAQGIAARFTVSSSKPSPATNGDAWFDTTEGTTYVYYDDGDSAQWIETGNPALGFVDVSNLTDVDLTSLADGDILVYNSSTGKWENGEGTLEALSDTNITTPTTGDALVYTGTNWENIPVSTGFEQTFLLMGA
jgi:hypothetical protein